MTKDDELYGKPITQEEIDAYKLKMEQHPEHTFYIKLSDECYALFLDLADNNPRKVAKAIEDFLEGFTASSDLEIEAS